MARFEESTYLARSIEHAFLGELGWEMLRNRGQKIDISETRMGDSFGYDYIITNMTQPNQPLHVQVKTCGPAPAPKPDKNGKMRKGKKTSEWPIKPILINNPQMELLVIDYEDDGNGTRNCPIEYLTRRPTNKPTRQRQRNWLPLPLPTTHQGNYTIRKKKESYCTRPDHRCSQERDASVYGHQGTLRSLVLI